MDPLNLTGVIVPGPRVPKVHTKSVMYRDGAPLGEEEAAALASEQRRLVAAG